MGLCGGAFFGGERAEGIFERGLFLERAEEAECGEGELFGVEGFVLVGEEVVLGGAPGDGGEVALEPGFSGVFEQLFSEGEEVCLHFEEGEGGLEADGAVFVLERGEGGLVWDLQVGSV